MQLENHNLTDYNHFSIREYSDTKTIYKQIDRLMAVPPMNLPKQAMEEYLRYYEEKCSISKANYEKAITFIPGGIQHNLAFNYPFPLTFTKAEGAYLYDIDGNQYIDFLQAGGPTVLGSNPIEVREKVIDLLNTCGPSTGLFHEYEYKIAKLICESMPGVDQFRSLNSGSEADVAAARLARRVTGKTKIIKMGGAYHGWMDQMLYGTRIPGTAFFEAKGVPILYSWHTQEVYPNKLNELESKLKWNQLRGGTAAVFMEPVGPESGTYPLDKSYIKGTRDLCDKYGALLVFDEVVTGFRIGMSGAQGYFGVTPDLTVFGKVVGGGYPSAGGLGGKLEYMDLLSHKHKEKVLVGGTLAANPLTSLAGYYTLEAIKNNDACAKAGRAGDRLTQGLQQLIQKYELPFVAYNQGSICHLHAGGATFVKLDFKRLITQYSKVKAEAFNRKHMMEEMGAAYMAEGIVSLAGSRLYTSMADTDEVIDEALVRFERVFSKYQS